MERSGVRGVRRSLTKRREGNERGKGDKRSIKEAKGRALEKDATQSVRREIMTVKIVTDSSCDLSAEIAQELGITVVPLYVRFGEEVYRERVDISDEEFYEKLQHGPIHPVTIQPTPQDFANVYEGLSQKADGIVSIHVSTKLSGTYNCAVQGKEMIEKRCPIEVVDSQLITISLGLVDIAAAAVANAGGNLQQVLEEVKQAIPNIHLLGLLDTLKYLLLGGRIW